MGLCDYKVSAIVAVSDMGHANDFYEAKRGDERARR
jgi:hypothetical protein